METIAFSMFFIVFLYYSFKVRELNKIKQDLEQSKEYNKSLSALNDNVRGFKHDFANILLAIGGYIASEDITGLKKYYSDLMIDYSKLNNLSSLNPNVINNPAVYGVLSNKYYTAEKNNITINLDIFMDLNSINMSTYEFTRILRNTDG